MPFSRPIADNSIGGWTDQDSGVTDIYITIAESSTNFSTWIQAISLPLGGDPDLPATFDLAAITPLSSGDQYAIVGYADASGPSGPHTLRVELLDGTVVKATSDVMINNVTNQQFVLLADASITFLSTPRIRFTLIHDTSEWRANVYQAWLQVVYSHIDIGTNGVLKNVLANSGEYITVNNNGMLGLANGIETSGVVVGVSGSLAIHG